MWEDSTILRQDGVLSLVLGASSMTAADSDLHSQALRIVQDAITAFMMSEISTLPFLEVWRSKAVLGWRHRSLSNGLQH